MTRTTRAADVWGGETEPLTRRDRQRLATLAEIEQTAMSLVRGGDEVSIRAVATAMGLTAPALYRYVDSAAALDELVTRAVFRDVIATMGRARDRQSADDPAAQIVASATAFRTWALRNPHEYRMVFGTPPGADMAGGKPRAGRASRPLLGQPVGPSSRLDVETELFCDFSGFFADIFLRLWQQVPFPVPATEALDPTFVAMCCEAADAKLPGVSAGPDALGILWTYEMAWARLYGIVTLEVFGHVSPILIESGAMFNATMLDIGRTIGLEHEWPRLREIAAAERDAAAVDRAEAATTSAT